MPVREFLTRFVDNKPLAAHLYVTDRCNLKCAYCNEYDNRAPHPETAELKARLRKIRELGAARIGFQGGEPLLHPDIVELVAYAKEIGFFVVGMSTNGIPLTEEMLRGLERAGLDSLQISVDRMTPSKSTRKALERVSHKLDWFKGSRVGLNVNGVLYQETIDQTNLVIEECLRRNISVRARVAHDDRVNERKVRDDAAATELLCAVEHQERLKTRGEPISTSWNIIEYQKALLTGRPVDWTCIGGYKFFFVSAQGKFWVCSQVRTDRDIMEITPDDLLAYNRRKKCQAGCGVYCTVDMSLAIKAPLTYFRREAHWVAKTQLIRFREMGKKRARHLLDRST